MAPVLLLIEDDSGRVLFHSDDKRSLWENFFKETDNNARLKAHVFSRTARPFQGTYWGKGASFYSTPLPAVPWSLVVFRNKELFRTTNFEAIILACALFAVYIIISLIVPVVIWLFNKARRRKMSMSWFWPDFDRPYWYYATIGFIFFLVGIPLFSCDILPDDCAVWFVFPYLLFSLTGLWFLIKVCPKRTQKISPEQLYRRYACMMVSFLLLFSALPMGIFFKTGADREMTLAMKYNLITLGHKLRQTPDLDFSRIQREIRGIDASPSPIAECSENDYWRNCTLARHSIHLSPIAKTSLCVSDNAPGSDYCNQTETVFPQNHKTIRTEGNYPSSPEASLLERFHRKIRENSLSRLSNPVSISTLGLIGDQPSGTPFHWPENSRSSSISLAFQAPPKHEQSGRENMWVILQSSLPSVRFSNFPYKTYFLPLIFPLIVFVGALVLVVVPIFVVSRIFPILPKSSTKENSNQAKRNLLIIGLPETLDISCAKKDNIDCRQISDLPEWWKIKTRVFYTKKPEVILDHFEYQLGVPQFDRAKLELLAALLAKGKQICVLSTINPLKLDREDDSEPSSPDESNRPASVSLQEWSQVFQSFALHYHKLETSVDSRGVPADEPSYEAIWQSRTIDEKITLHYLAQDGFVHAENQNLHHLFELGLIEPKPAPRLVDGGFKEYVLNAAQRDQLGAIERVKRRSLWYVWKWPLAIVFFVLVMGLLLTQQEFGSVLVVMLSLLPVLLPTLSGLEQDGNVS